MTILAICTDLIFRTKIREAAGDNKPIFVRTIDDAKIHFTNSNINICILDLECVNEGLEEFVMLVPSQVRVVAFGSHVEKEKLDSAVKAGVKDVVPRSKFVNLLPSICS